MDPLLKKKLCILIHLADIDGEFAKVERTFIDDIAFKNGVSPDELDKLISCPDPIGSLGALSYNKAVEYLCDCLSLMAIDHKILPSEVLLCEDIGLRLGFMKQGVDTIIDSLRSNPELSTARVERAVRALDHISK